MILNPSVLIDMHRHVRRILLGGAAGLTLAGALIGASALQPRHVGASSVRGMSATYITFPTAASLTHGSVAVVVGEVIDAGTTHLVYPSLPQQPPAQPSDPAGPPPGKTGATPSAPPPVDPGRSIDHSLPVTTFSFRVSRVIRGAMSVGDQISLKQLGGVVSPPPPGSGQSQTIVDDHDPLMVAGQPQLVFLGQNADGSFYVVGGPQGRFTISNDRVFPIDSEAPIAQGRTGQLLEDFVAEVQAVS